MRKVEEWRIDSLAEMFGKRCLAALWRAKNKNSVWF
jgi:hypothetical protein